MLSTISVLPSLKEDDQAAVCTKALARYLHQHGVYN
jgi:hypothetical protein